MDVPVRLGLTDRNVHPTGKLPPTARLTNSKLTNCILAKVVCVVKIARGYTGAAPFLRSASRYRFYADVDFHAILGFRVVLGKDIVVETAAEEK